MADGFGLKEMLDGRIAAARRALSGPAMLRAAAPLGLWLAFFLIFWLSGLYTAMPLETQALAGVVFWLGAIAGVWLVTARWRKPTEEDARDLIDATIEGRPMEAWADKPARADELGLTLWLTHRDRMGALAKDAKTFNVAPYYKKADPLYLRLIAPTLVLVAAIVANVEAPARLKAGLLPDFGALFGAHKLTYEAFLSPPTWSGDPPTVLKPNVTVETMEGSIVTLRMLSPGRPTVVIHPQGAGSASLHPGPDPVDGSYQAVIRVDRPMRIAIEYWGNRGYYDLKLKADAAPKIEFVAPPKLIDGDLTEFEYKATDDFGVSKIALVVRPKTLPKEALTTKGARLEDAVEIEMQGFEPKEEAGKQAMDLVRNRYAGLDVMVKMRATDAAGHVGESGEVAYKLPRKIFLQPNARSAQEVREKIMQEWRPYAAPFKDDRFANSRRTGWDNVNTAAASRLEKAPEGVKLASTMLEAITFQPEDYFVDPLVFAGFAQSKAIIATAQNMEEAEYAEGILWSTALLAEYGSLSDATAALEAARRALEEALRNGASDEEIKRLMDMFEQAVENYLAARMAEALKNGRVSDGDQQQSQQGGGRQPMDGDELQRMLDALRDMSANGARDQARALLNQMQQTLDRLKDMQLQVSRGGGGQQGQNDVMNRALNRALQDTNRTLNDQRDLNDATEQAERQGGNPQRGQQLADQQRQLRERLEQQMRSGGGQPQQGQQGQGQQGQQGQGGQGQQGQQGQGQQGQGQGQQGQGQMGQGTQPGQGQQGQGTRGPPRPGQGGQQGQQGQPGGQFGQNQGDPGRGGPPGSEAGPGQGQETERSRRMLAQAIEAQRRSEDALRRGDFAGARQAQQEAMAALQGRASELARAADENDPDNKKEADPLGRLSDGTSGSGENVKVPDEVDRQRVQDIFDELRRRASDRTLPQQEQDYLRRLLDVFTR